MKKLNELFKNLKKHKVVEDSLLKLMRGALIKLTVKKLVWLIILTLLTSCNSSTNLPKNDGTDPPPIAVEYILEVTDGLLDLIL
ncbi:hypothetical protein BTA51_25990 [Hahella sp. CCB-MM4]|uniref:hypothetical protein n=1 Tax=Hahella sp. (strain CCB-MM4) TaxID=1926491 RepID=UPI000B9AFB4C|nr:hypothetical protein [Hahella sp. CCB-MM4]OZG70422.1 hypothetical protein BTA51_25990 [Hahella sp. CCB-MM4]